MIWIAWHFWHLLPFFCFFASRPANFRNIPFMFLKRVWLCHTRMLLSSMLLKPRLCLTWQIGHISAKGLPMNNCYNSWRMPTYWQSIWAVLRGEWKKEMCSFKSQICWGKECVMMKRYGNIVISFGVFLTLLTSSSLFFFVSPLPQGPENYERIFVKSSRGYVTSATLSVNFTCCVRSIFR